MLGFVSLRCIVVGLQCNDSLQCTILLDFLLCWKDTIGFLNNTFVHSSLGHPLFQIVLDHPLVDSLLVQGHPLEDSELGNSIRNVLGEQLGNIARGHLLVDSVLGDTLIASG